MKIWIVLIALAVAAHAAPADNDESIEAFEKEFNELWSDPKDQEAAKETLEKEEAEIAKQNELFKEGKSTFSEAVNELSDIPKEEFEAEKEGLIVNAEAALGGFATGLIETPEEFRITSDEDRAYLNSIYAETDRVGAPYSYDARSRGLITEPKNQMSCGSCAAFAATSVHETCLIRAGSRKNGLDLSEQQLVDCAYDGNGANGCHGAWVGKYQDWMAKVNGGKVAHEAQYPYLDRDPNLYCKNKATWNPGAKISRSINEWQCDENKLKALVAKYGAVATGIYASDDGFSNVRSGVFQGCSTTKINHAVTVVGYGNQGGVDYWLVKNSWGPNWGDRGYIKIRRGTNECGIAGSCVVTECDYIGGASPAPVAPPPPPIPANQKCDLKSLYANYNLNGSYTLRTNVNGKEYVANVKCTNSICSPQIAGPSNACMYICGKITC